VIDIDESDIKPVNPKRRPRNNSGDNASADRPKNRNSESDNFTNGEVRETGSSGRRRRPSSRPSAYPSTEIPDTDDF
jgi:hypothetical protein